MSINGVSLRQKSSIGAAKGFFELLYCINTRSRYCTASASTATSHTRKESNSNSYASSSNDPRRFYSTTSSSSYPTKGPYSSSPSSSPPTPTAEPPLSTTLRHLMRHLPHSVVVLTTSTSNTNPPNPYSSHPPPSHPAHERKGMTLSSFTTLTLTPTPIITFNIRRPSQTLSALLQSRVFLIHILNGNVAGASLAQKFTRGNSPELFKDLDVEDEVIEIRNGEGEVVCPRIKDNQAVERVLVCDVEGGEGNEKGFVQVGDHVVVVAGVREILGEERKGEKRYGLSYVDGRYRGVGWTIEIEGEEKRGVEAVIEIEDFESEAAGGLMKEEGRRRGRKMVQDEKL